MTAKQTLYKGWLPLLYWLRNESVNLQLIAAYAQAFTYRQFTQLGSIRCVAAVGNLDVRIVCSVYGGDDWMTDN